MVSLNGSALEENRLSGIFLKTGVTPAGIISGMRIFLPACLMTVSTPDFTGVRQNQSE